MTVRRRKRRDKTGAMIETWMIDVRWKDGRRVREVSPVNTRRGAEDYERQVRDQLLAGTYGREPAPTLETFAEKFLAWCEAQRQKPSGIQAKRSILKHHLIPVLGQRRLDELTGADLLEVQTHLREAGAGPKTTNNVLSVLSKLLRVALRVEALRHMPVAVELVKVAPPDMEHLEEDELDRILVAARKHDPRTVAVVLLGADAGLRVGEMVALEWTDVNLRRREIHVRRNEWKGKVEAPKGGRGRRVPMTSRLADALTAIRHLRGPRVFWRDDGEPVTTRVLELRVNAAAKSAGLDVSGCHMLRHTFCSRLAVRGAAPVAIQRAAGHASLQAVQRYLHLAPAHVDRTIALLEQTPAGHTEGTKTETAP
jgi:integrase